MLPRRREFLTLLGATILSAKNAFGIQRVPFVYANLDHVSLQISNIDKSLEFYTKVFGGALRKEDESPRSYVQLGSGYMAVSQFATGRTARIDHFCGGLRNISIPETRQLLRQMGIQFTEPPPFGLFFSDPDGIRIQLWTENSWTDVGRTTAPLITPRTGDGIFTPLRLDQLTLTVADLEKASSYYQALMGPVVGREGDPARVWFQMGESRIALARIGAAQSPAIERFRVAVATFDHNAAQRKLEALGASLQGSQDGVVSFRDPDGIRVEVA
jgi:catechol 2,3-dioxygenase-like lactoylglutathione lyase family enzyme